MARSARKPKDDDSGVIHEKDFAHAVKLFRHDIKPALSKVGEHNQEAATAYKAIKKTCHIQPQAAKLAFKLDGMEEAKRDDFLRCFTGLLAELNIPLEPTDMVDMMQGDEGDAPSGPAPRVSRPRPKLVTIPSDGSETDLADAAFEAPAEELAKQKGRGRKASVDEIGDPASLN